MTELGHTKVVRKGGTARYYKEESGAGVTIEGFPAKLTYFPRMHIKFSLPVPGGTTDVRLVIGAEDFEMIADAMMKTNGEAATRAFARAVFFSAKSKEVERSLYPGRGRKKKA